MHRCMNSLATVEATGYGKSFAYSGDFTAAADEARKSEVGDGNAETTDHASAYR